MRQISLQGEKRVLFDATKDGQNIAPKWVAPEEEQETNESRRSVLLLAMCIHPTDVCNADYGRA